MTRGPADLSLFRGPGNPNPLSPLTTGVPFWLQWWHTRRLKETPCPHPTDPMQPLSGQTELPTLYLWRCALYTQVWQFTMAIGPLQCLQNDAEILHMRHAPAMECLTIYPLNTEVNLKKNRLPQTSSKISLTSQKIPWLCPKFQFSLPGKSLLNFPGFPVWVGTLTGVFKKAECMSHMQIYVVLLDFCVTHNVFLSIILLSWINIRIEIGIFLVNLNEIFKEIQLKYVGCYVRHNGHRFYWSEYENLY